MASGVKVTDQVKDVINEMKVVKSDADQNERIRMVIFKIQDSFIKVEEIFREKDLEKEGDVYKFFVSKLVPKTCCYLLYDCHFETKESSRKEELVFVMWAPDCAHIKEKMQYASSKDAIRKVMTGIKHMLEINDLSDYNNRDNFAATLGKGVIKIEGNAVSSTH